MRLALAIATLVLTTVAAACHSTATDDTLNQNRDRTSETMLQAAAAREQAARGDAGPDAP